jgi:hypothetical protein
VRFKRGRRFERQRKGKPDNEQVEVIKFYASQQHQLSHFLCLKWNREARVICSAVLLCYYSVLVIVILSLRGILGERSGCMLDLEFCKRG